MTCHNCLTSSAPSFSSSQLDPLAIPALVRLWRRHCIPPLLGEFLMCASGCKNVFHFIFYVLAPRQRQKAHSAASSLPSPACLPASSFSSSSCSSPAAQPLLHENVLPWRLCEKRKKGLRAKLLCQWPKVSCPLSHSLPLSLFLLDFCCVCFCFGSSQNAKCVVLALPCFFFGPKNRYFSLPPHNAAYEQRDESVTEKGEGERERGKN